MKSHVLGHLVGQGFICKPLDPRPGHTESQHSWLHWPSRVTACVPYVLGFAALALDEHSSGGATLAHSIIVVKWLTWFCSLEPL